MILNPYFWLALLALCGVCYMAGCTHERGEVTKVQAAWDAEKAQIKANEERIAQERKDADAKAAANAAQIAAARDLAFSDLQKRHDSLAGKLGACNNDRNLLNSLRDTVDSANAATARPAAPAEKGTPVAAPATGIDDWFVRVAKLYSECVDEVIDWQVWYAGIQASR